MAFWTVYIYIWSFFHTPAYHEFTLYDHFLIRSLSVQRQRHSMITVDFLNISPRRLREGMWLMRKAKSETACFVLPPFRLFYSFFSLRPACLHKHSCIRDLGTALRKVQAQSLFVPNGRLRPVANGHSGVQTGIRASKLKGQTSKRPSILECHRSLHLPPRLPFPSAWKRGLVCQCGGRCRMKGPMSCPPHRQCSSPLTSPSPPSIAWHKPECHTASCRPHGHTGYYYFLHRQWTLKNGNARYGVWRTASEKGTDMQMQMHRCRKFQGHKTQNAKQRR